MSFLFEPVSAAIDTLKYIKSASDKGPDPNRFVTRMPPNPGKWALATAYKRHHNLWKWTHYRPSKIPRKKKSNKRKQSMRLRLVAQPSASFTADGDPKAVDKAINEQTPSKQPVDTINDMQDTDQSLSDISSVDGKKRRSKASAPSSVLGDAPLDDDGLPYFPIPDDEDVESENRKVSNMSPEQKVYYRACEHYKVKPLRPVMKQIDSNDMVLAYTQIRDLEFKSITTSLVMNFTVKRFDMTAMCPSQRQMTYLNDYLEDDNGITDLILKDNKLEGRILHRLFESMQHRDVIVYLDVSGNNLRDKDLPYLAAYIESSSQLNYLHMARNKFSAKAGEALGKMMANASLLELNVSGNQIRGDGMVAFLNGVARNATLESLNVSWNGIGPEAIRGLCNIFKSSANLHTIDLTGTRLNSECLDLMFTQGLVKNTNLQRIIFTNNQLLTSDYMLFFQRLANSASTGLRRIDLGDYQVLDAALEPLLEQLFHDKRMDVRAGPFFTQGKKSTDVETVVEHFRQDHFALVARMNAVQRDAMVRHFTKFDMDEAMETGSDIPSCSFLGRVNDNKLTYQDLAQRVRQAEGKPRDVIASVLDQLEENSKTNLSHLKIVTRLSADFQETRKRHIFGDFS